MKNSSRSSFLLSTLALVLILATVSSETWAQNLDLTIPSLEMQSTWELDWKAKPEIMTELMCCLAKKHIDNVRKDRLLRSTELLLKEKQNLLPYLQFDQQHTNNGGFYWLAINVLDVYTTNRALNKNPYVVEMNPLLPSRPSLEELILHKILVLGYIEWVNADINYDLPNMILTAAVINNYRLGNSPVER